MKRSIELLAPARCLSTAKEAILHGADAVYIGAPRFGARAAAGNSLEDIRELVAFAHPFRVKVYVTLNTILFDDELEDAQQLIFQLYEIGVDALIVQDMALLEMKLPPIALHASTQMDNRSAEKVKWLHGLGFSQAVLARELTIDEISAIHKAVPEMPLEVFVHGATCVSYNGQCYASQYCFGRSANRGECAQFCRLPFDLIDEQGRIVCDVRDGKPIRQKHILSLHDMNRSNELEELLDAGAVSLKIEGRLKDEAYVKNVTSYYRQCLDEIIMRRSDDFQRSSLGVSTISFTPQLAKTFNRGFSNYFLHGRTPDMVQLCSPKHVGEPVGTVKEIRRNCFTVRGTASFNNGDGLCFIDDDGRLQGVRINRVEGNCLFPKEMPVGLQSRMPLYRNSDQSFLSLLTHPTAQRKIAVAWVLKDGAAGENSIFVSVQSEDGWYVQYEFSYELAKARTPQQENVKKQLSRLGDTIYQCADVDVDFSEEWFIPSSVLADWRRQMIEMLDKQRAAGYVTEKRLQRGLDQEKGDMDACLSSSFSTTFSSDVAIGCEVSSGKFVSEVLDYNANVSNHLAKSFYQKQGARVVSPALEVSADNQSKGSSGLRIMTLRYCPRYELGLCGKSTGGRLGHAVAEMDGYTTGRLSLRSSDGKVFPLHFDCKKCMVHVCAPSDSVK